MSDLLARAGLICVTAHMAVGQKRKYTGEPYHVHCFNVMQLVLGDGCLDDEVLAAALLHDVVEDTKMTLHDLTSLTTRRVAELVYWCSDLEPRWYNRKTRKEMSRARLFKAPDEAKLIKLADLIDNTSDITQHDPDFAKVYMQEKNLLLPNLWHLSGEKLYRRAEQQLIDYAMNKGITA